MEIQYDNFVVQYRIFEQSIETQTPERIVKIEKFNGFIYGFLGCPSKVYFIHVMLSLYVFIFYTRLL